MILRSWYCASILALAISTMPLWAQSPGDAFGQLPSGFESSLTPDDDASALIDGGAVLAPDLGGSLTDEAPSAVGTTVVEPIPLFDQGIVGQPTVVGNTRDPLAARRKAKSNVQFQIRTGIEYNDNVFIDGQDKDDDVAFTIAPTLSVNAGDFRNQQAAYLSAAYTATGSAYLKNTTPETLDHLLQFQGQLKEKKITIPFAIQLSRETGAFLDLGGRDTAESYGGRLGIEYALGPKVSLGGAAESSMTDYEIFADFHSFLAEAYVNYRISSKTTVSGVYRFADSKTDGADNQSYQAALVRVDARPTAKINARAEAGVAFSSLSKGDRSDLIYRVGVAYQPNSKQRLSMEAVRQPSTSAFTVGSGFINNGLQVTFEQALGHKTRLLLNGGYQHQDYFAAEEGVTADRQDDFFVFSSLLAYDINPHWQAELYYTYSSNESNDTTLDFDNQQVGMGLNWIY